MIRRIPALFAAAFLSLLSFMPAAQAQTGQAAPAGLSFPMSATGAQGVFTGTLRIARFAVQDNALVATGVVTGTLVGPAGATSIARTVTVPVSTSPASRTAAAAIPGGCEILHLELGPLDLDVLGLVVHLDKVVLDLTAVPGAGNLLGNLLCSVTNLLNTGGALTQIANLLNQNLGLLG